VGECGLGSRDSRQEQAAGSCEHDNEHLGSINVKGEEFLTELSDC
jgi:hypothetical protein